MSPEGAEGGEAFGAAGTSLGNTLIHCFEQFLT